MLSVKMDEFLLEFLKDAREDLDQIEDGLLFMEKQISGGTEISYDVLNKVFRHFHSIKGNASFFELTSIVNISHNAETLLDIFRKKKHAVTCEHVEPLLKTSDYIRRLVVGIEKGVNDAALENESTLHAEFLKKITPKDESSSEKVSVGESPANSPSVIDPKGEKKPAEKKKKWGLFTDEAKKPESEIVSENPKSLNSGKKPATRELLPEGEIASEALTFSQSAAKDIRINTEKLDAMMDLIGELVVAESMVTKQAHQQNYNVEMVKKSTVHLGKIVRYIQEAGLSMRMIPVEGMFRKMSRLVRDLSRKFGKRVELLIRGEDTEIDKTIVEQISDPLVHIIRNAIDHGLESEEGRKAAGKSSCGNIILEARHSGSEIWIIIKDDGRGLNREKIIKKAIERGIVGEEAASWSDEEVWELIFSPGFSTAEEVTDVSGRGVGMDVVKKNIESLKGRIEVKSRLGEGSTFILRIPLTLAIIDGIVVRCASRFLVIPTENIKHLIDMNKLKVSKIHDNIEVVKIRDVLIPIGSVEDFLNYRLREEGEVEDSKVVVIIENDRREVGIKVDEIIGTQQVVIKTLSGYLNRVKGISGGAILGNGEVGLVLDAEHFLKKFTTHVSSDSIEETIVQAKS